MVKLLLFIISFTLLTSCGGDAENISTGDLAPDFTLQDHSGSAYTLSDFKGGSPVVIYFYPKANTPGCTKQACGIRDEYAKFTEAGIKIFGISVDSKEDIKEFVDENNLNFPLLADTDKEVARKYGVLNNGKANRITFVIDKNGIIANIIRDVNVETHSQTVYELAKKLI